MTNENTSFSRADSENQGFGPEVETGREPLIERIGGWLNGFIDWVASWRIFNAVGRMSTKLFVLAAIFTFVAIRGADDTITFGLATAAAENANDTKEFGRLVKKAYPGVVCSAYSQPVLK